MNYPKNILCFATNTNSPGLHDGDYFYAEANRAIGEWKAATIVKVPNDQNRSDLVLDEIEKHGPADVYAFFMHGSIKSLIGAGFTVSTKYPLTHGYQNVSKLARSISDRKTPYNRQPIKIILYACSTGGPPEGQDVVPQDWPESERERLFNRLGFAHSLSFYLGLMGIIHKIIAHVSPKGDTTRNPRLCSVQTNTEDSPITETVYYRPWIIKNFGKKAWPKFVEIMKYNEYARFRVPFLELDENFIANLEK
jgi:hypothetical protein